MKQYLAVMETIIGAIAMLSISMGGMMADNTGAGFAIAIKLLFVGIVALMGVLVVEYLKGAER